MNKETMKRIMETLKKEYNIPKFAKQTPYEALISTVLSQRTVDKTTDRVAGELFVAAKNMRELSKLSQKQIAKIIKPVNFYKTKAMHIKQIAKMIESDFNGKIPKSREDLMKLPGVGPKTADCVLSFSYGEHVVPIDTHVEVVAKRLGIAIDSDDYGVIQEKINNIVPEKKRDVVNYLLVEHGKKVCRKHMPKHGICEIRRWCRFYIEMDLKKPRRD